MLPDQTKKEFISVWVRDPRIQKEDFWHSYLDYEICIHTNSMCFTLKTSCVRRRFREFVWLRQRLQSTDVLLTEIPQLPFKNPFFNIHNPQHVEQRRQGLQEFLESVLQSAVLLSDSQLHLFLQSQLSTDEIEACVSGQTEFSVSDAIQRFATSNRRFPEEKQERNYSDSDSESSSSGLGHSSDDNASQGCRRNTSQGDVLGTVSSSSSHEHLAMP
ncbi:sorting nexin-10 [Protopterus annectens]|uniref:sorting nexin-10 n=1 Tax=Protopterus annectens TaxID=7888 RepID=UPI001CFC3DDC|nr:sorting nexin-10 [Protopterus annectens]XP_043922721.1 sorting nexin-10 [Protopterus annectens]